MSAWAILAIILTVLGTIYLIWWFVERQRYKLEKEVLLRQSVEIENARLTEEKKAQSMSVESQLLRINDLLRDREQLRKRDKS